MDDLAESPDWVGVRFRDAAERPAASGGVSLLDMLKRYAFSFYEVVVRLEQLRNEARLLAPSGYAAPAKVDVYKRDTLIACLQAMRAECEILELTHTASLVSFSESEVQRKAGDYTYVDMLKELDTVSYSFAAELRRHSCFRIAPEKERYFEKEDLFGPAVSQAFESCIEGIRRAGTCYALEQPEACVYHLMRVLERSLGVLASKLHETFERDTWHTLIKRLEVRIGAMDAVTFGADWKDRQKFYSRAASQFMFFKDAWRNHVMHGHEAFDDGKAHSVYESVKGFMLALAEGGLHD